jgi:hypothetical protein
LEIINIADSDFSIFLFGFEFKFDLEDDDLGIGELLRLLLETSIGEGLLEGDSANQERIIDGTAGNLLDTDQFFI